MKDNEFKVDEWVWCDTKEYNDHRKSKDRPIFQVKEVGHRYLRAEIKDGCGVHHENCRLATPTEIAEYKLKNRISVEATKNNDFVDGKWYNVFAYHPGVPYIIKYNSNNFDNIEYISIGVHRGLGGFNNVKLVSEISLEEIQQYLPEGHVDLIVKPVIEDTIPQKGSYIEFIVDYTSGNCELGVIYKVQYIMSTFEDIHGGNNHCCSHGDWKNYYKVSTQEAFEAQAKPVNVIPEYVECIKGNGGKSYNTVGTVYKVDSYDKATQCIVINGKIIASINFENPISGNTTDYKISTKAAYDAYYAYDEQLKRFIAAPVVEEWSVGTYVVFLKDYGGHPKGTVDTIENKGTDIISCSLRFEGGTIPCNQYRDSLKWFATKVEAEEFAKTITGIKPKEEKMLVFGKYEIGTIVVSLEDVINCRKNGDIYKVFLKSSSNNLVYTEKGYTSYSKPSQWRAATTDEIEAYKNGITNINQIKIKTNEEDLTGRYLKALVNKPNRAKVDIGRYVLITENNNKIQDIYGAWVYRNSDIGTLWELMPVGFSPNTSKTMNKEKLLAEAKRRYPVGCEFRPAHVNNEDIHTVLSHDLENPSEFPKHLSFKSKKGEYGWVSNVYSNGKWAEIISMPEVKDDYKLTSDGIVCAPESDYVMGVDSCLLLLAKEAYSRSFNTNTIGYWLQQLPDPIRMSAFTNHFKHPIGKYNLNARADGIHSALHRAFFWTDSLKGHNYWYDIANGSYNQEKPLVINYGIGCSPFYNPKTTWVEKENNLLSFDDELIFIDKPKKVTSIKTQLLVLEE